MNKARYKFKIGNNNGNKQNIIRKNILESLSKKKTAYVKAAKLVLGNEKLEEDFILECYEQCHTDGFQNMLGENLFNDLINYNKKYNNKLNILLKKITKIKTNEKGKKGYMASYFISKFSN